MSLERWGRTVVRAAAGEIRAVSLFKTLLLLWDGREFCLSPSLLWVPVGIHYCKLNFARDCIGKNMLFMPGEEVIDLCRSVESLELKYYILIGFRAEEQPWEMKATVGKAGAHLRHSLRVDKTTTF